MEPVLLLILGVISIVGQLNNYGIDVEKHPHLKDIRVRREVEFQPYAVEENVQIPVKTTRTSTMDDTIPEELSIKSILKGDLKLIRKKREPFDPKKLNTLHQLNNPSQANNGNNNQKYNGYNQATYSPALAVVNPLYKKASYSTDTYGQVTYNNGETHSSGVNSVTEPYNNEYNKNNRYNSVNSNGYTQRYPSNYNNDIVVFSTTNTNNGYNNRFYSPYRSNTVTALLSSTAATTTWNPVKSQFIIHLGCPKFMTNVKLFGKRFCIDDANAQKNSNNDNDDDYE